MKRSVNRRALLGGTAAAAALGALALNRGGADASVSGNATDASARPGATAAPDVRGGPRDLPPPAPDDFRFEIIRSEADWRDRLSDEEFRILREGGTELPETSDLWNVFDPGLYSCRGCDLPLFSSEWKRDVNLGWNFFRHCQPNAILTGIDGPVAAYGQSMGNGETMIEAHCRRCGSHLGHLLRVRRDTLYCINGKALLFRPAPA